VGRRSALATRFQGFKVSDVSRFQSGILQDFGKDTASAVPLRSDFDGALAPEGNSEFRRTKCPIAIK
jgi:hypothetical protein